ncbi:MAG TPA: hypothetical protein VMB35_09000 [Methanomicrobiales archaeon]|nr:hypothetical protein [Methanomicrobiales archaeon]
MERYRFLAISLPLIAAAVSAQAPFSLQTESALFMEYVNNYYLPVVGTIIVLFLVFSALRRFVRKGSGAIDFGVSLFGGLLAVALVVTGIVCIAAAAALAWGSATRDMTFAWADQWAVPLSEEILAFLINTAGPIFNADSLQSIILGILILGGGILVLVGIFVFMKLPRASFYEILKPSGTTTFREVMTRGQEPLAPTVTFKVIDRLTNAASPDVKVVLKHKEGGKVYTRYTDFNGEVVFQKIDGLYSQYYAYVEGDEERKRYWVIRTAIGAESVT